MDAAEFAEMMTRAQAAGEAEREVSRLLGAVGLTREQCIKLAEWLRYRNIHMDGHTDMGTADAADQLEAAAPYIEFPQRHATGMGTP